MEQPSADQEAADTGSRTSHQERGGRYGLLLLVLILTYLLSAFTAGRIIVDLQLFLAIWKGLILLLAAILIVS